MRGSILALAAMAVSTTASAQEAQEVRFISCPVFRDVNNGKRGGCWLSTDPESGIRYDVTNNVYPPDWNHPVLVEGQPNGQEQCGGVRLDPVRTSVLQGHCPRHMLPAEGYELARPTLPERNVRPSGEERTVPDWPFTDRTMHIFFEFDSDFITFYHSDSMVDKAVTWLRAAQPSRIVVTGYAVTDPAQVSGQDLAEMPEMAQRRAQLMFEVLRDSGIDPEIIETRWDYNPDAVSDDPWADGLVEPSRRRVDISAEF